MVYNKKKKCKNLNGKQSKTIQDKKPKTPWIWKVDEKEMCWMFET